MHYYDLRLFNSTELSHSIRSLSFHTVVCLIAFFLGFLLVFTPFLSANSPMLDLSLSLFFCVFVCFLFRSFILYATFGDFYIMGLCQVYNPSSGEVIADVPLMGRRETNDAISSAFDAYNCMKVLIDSLCHYALFSKKHFYCFSIACAHFDFYKAKTVSNSFRVLGLII